MLVPMASLVRLARLAWLARLALPALRLALWLAPLLALRLAPLLALRLALQLALRSLVRRTDATPALHSRQEIRVRSALLSAQMRQHEIRYLYV